MTFRPMFIAAVLAAAAPAAAFAAPLNPGGVFAHAAPLQKLIMAALILGSLAAIAVLARKVASREGLAGGSAFISGLRFGGPVIGILGASYAGLNMALGLANVPVEPTLKVLAPGFAEMVLMLGLGFLAGTVAVIAHWAIESRIDRQVLGA